MCETRYLRQRGLNGVNFLLRVLLWATQTLDSLEVGPLRATRIPVLDLHELAAGKIVALLDRTAGRDIFDVRALLSRDELSLERLRLAFVVYGGMSRRDWCDVCIDDVEASHEEIDRHLVPVLRGDLAPDRSELPAWSAALATECRSLLSAVLPLCAQDLESRQAERLRGDRAYAVDG